MVSIWTQTAKVPQLDRAAVLHSVRVVSHDAIRREVSHYYIGLGGARIAGFANGASLHQFVESID